MVDTVFASFLFAFCSLEAADNRLARGECHDAVEAFGRGMVTGECASSDQINLK
jgi:hypothetical protein